MKRLATIVTFFSVLVSSFGTPLTVLARLPNDIAWTQDAGVPMIKLPDAWEYTQGSADIVVAVIDTGIDITNPDLAANIWTNPADPADGIDNDKNGYIDDVHGWNFFDNNSDVRPQPGSASTRIGLNHGTVVAGIIGAVGNNEIGSAGVNWHVRIMPLKILDNKGDGDSDLAVKAIDYAILKRANIINLSFVGPTPSLNFIQAIRRAYRSGILVVAAAGNAQETGNGINLNNTPQYPVCFDDPLKEENWVLGVAALNDNGQLSKFSNYGDKCIDVAAPGTHIASTQYFDPANGYGDLFGGSWSGTSIAAPYVSGVAALVKSIQPAWSPDQLRNAILKNTDPIPGNDSLSAGRGSLNALKAVRYALQGGDGGVPMGVFMSVVQKGNSAHVKLVDPSFKDLKTFEISRTPGKGAIAVMSADLDGSGIANIVAAIPDAKGTLIKFFQRDGKLLKEKRPFGKQVKGPVTLHARDIDQDGHDEIIISDTAANLVTVMHHDGSLGPVIRVPERGIHLAATTIRFENSIYIVTAVQRKNDAMVYLWDEIGSFVRAFSVEGTGALTIGTVDRSGNGVESLFVGHHNGKDLDVKILAADGVQAERIVSKIPVGRIFGYTFAHVQGEDGNRLIIAAQEGIAGAYNIMNHDGSVRQIKKVNAVKGFAWQSLLFGR